MRRHVRRIFVALAAALALALVLLLITAAATPLPVVLREGNYAASIRFLDRGGGLLREVRADDTTRAQWVPLERMGKLPILAVLAAEDRRFYEHPGVDPVAVVRAAAADVAHRRVVSGASTLTMQLARLVRPGRRDVVGKFLQMALALRIEASLSKRDIVEQYLNRAPFGPGVRGIDAASRAYFDKPPDQLSLAEAATVASLPRGPSLYSLDKHPERARRRRDRVLDRMLAAGWITSEEHDRAVREPLVPGRPRGSFDAPHFVQALASGKLDGVLPSGVQTVRTTIDADLQRETETAVRELLRPLARRHVTSASAVVLENATGDVLAYVGSPAWDDAAHGGQNDGVRALRQPGSTLKPFVYGLAMEKLGYTAATVLPDVELHLPVAGGVFAPNNYDGRFHGPVRLREALASSLNVPAVWTAAQLGSGPLLERLHDLGFASLAGAPDAYGPGLALGDGEVTLLELANAYATLARDGVWRPIRAVRDAEGRGGGALAPGAGPRRVMPVEVSRALTDVLADDKARAASFGEGSVLSFPFDVAAKTGTSKGYRDNWTVGFTRDVTVAVWVGNFDGRPMQDVSGITGAGPIFAAVLEAAMRSRPKTSLMLSSRDSAADGFARVEICPLSGAAATSACPHHVTEWLPRGAAPLPPCSMHERLAIDRRNNLLAGRGVPAAFVDYRVFERLDGEYGAWARSAGRPTAPALASAGRARATADSSASLVIGYPHEGARYLIEPDRPRADQTLSVRVEAPERVARVTLRVDGLVVATAPRGAFLSWPLVRGEHVLVAEAPGLPPSDPLHIDVE